MKTRLSEYRHFDRISSSMPINNSTLQERTHQVLDPSLLGRPVHLLPAFAAAFGDDLAAMLGAPSSRRFWGGFALIRVEFVRAPEGGALRWLGMDSGHGVARVAFERALLVGLLEARYSKGQAQLLRDPGAERITATEERLALTLTQQLSEVLAKRVRVAAAGAGVGLPSTPLAPAGTAVPGRNAWALTITLREPQGEREARCFIAPDARMMGQILQALQPERPQRAQRQAEPLGASLKLKLESRLVSHEMTLEALFGLKVGDVIPVTVGRADVLLDEARLFTAAVAEHKGKLCLTSFEDTE
ncbi:MAG: FliM/FliN family flagellar motor switch protein [Telluria sp.]